MNETKTEIFKIPSSLQNVPYDSLNAVFEKLSQYLSQLFPFELVMTNKNYEYRLPTLHDFGGDMSKRWTVEFYVWNCNLKNGKGALQRKQKRIPLKLSKKERKELAKKYIEAITSALYQGAHIPLNSDDKHIHPDEHRLNVTVKEAYEYILSIKKPLLKPNSYKDYRIETEHFLAFVDEYYSEDILLRDFTTPMAIQYLDHVQTENNLTNRTRNNKLTYLRTLGNDLKTRGYSKTNFWDGIKKEKSKEPQNYPFREWEKQKLWPKMKNEDPQLFYASMFIYYLFLRPSEIHTLKIRQIQWDQEQVMIPNSHKSGRAKYPTISTAFMEILEEMGLKDLNPEWYVFGYYREPGPEPLNDKSLTRRFHKMRNELGLANHFSFYCWKHTGNLDSFLAGVNLKALQSQNGHSEIKHTDIYLRSLGCEHNEQIKSLQPKISF